jgi:hypothetical protein
MNYEKEMEEWESNEKGELEYGTSGNYEDEDDSSFDDYLKDSGISKSTDNEEVDKDVVDMSDGVGRVI